MTWFWPDVRAVNGGGGVARKCQHGIHVVVYQWRLQAVFKLNEPADMIVFCSRHTLDFLEATDVGHHPEEWLIRRRFETPYGTNKASEQQNQRPNERNEQYSQYRGQE